MIVRAAILPLVAATLLVCAAPARAQGSPYRLYPAADATTMAASAVLWWGPSLFRGTFVEANACPCAASGLNALDRGIAGRYHPGISRASDVAHVSTLLLTVLLDGLDVRAAGEPVLSLLTDVVVLGETALVNGAINELAKVATARPRPLVYGRAPGDPLLADPENYVSFYSAHTSGAFAIGLAYAQTFAYRHPDSPWRFVLYAGAIAAGSGIGAMRIASGKHFVTDVLVGAAAGTGIGLVIPWLHRAAAPARLDVQLAPDRVVVALALREL